MASRSSGVRIRGDARRRSAQHPPGDTAKILRPTRSTRGERTGVPRFRRVRRPAGPPLDRSGRKTLLIAGPKENFARPAADPLFRSAAVNYGARVIGIILTAHLDDGAAGLKAVDACGGFVAVQDPAESPAPGMPLNALRAVKPDVVASVAELSLFVMTLLDQPVVEKPEASNIQRIAAIETQIASTGRSSVDIIESIGSRTPLTCPECGGVVWRIGDSAPLRYRCHTGHAFSGRSLEEVQRQQTENALWSVVRGLQERLTLAKQQLVNLDDASEQEAISARIESLVVAEEAAYGLLRDTVHGVCDQRFTDRSSPCIGS